MKNNKIISHIILESILLGICIWDRIVNIPKYPYNFFYMTQIDLYLHMTYFALIIFEDIKYGNSFLAYQQFFNFCFSISFLCFVMYWGMILFNPNTLYKKGITIPFLLNFSLHGGVFFISLFEQLLINKRRNPTYIKWYVNFIYTLLYTILLKSLYIFWEIKVYPFAYKSNLLLIGVNLAGFVVSMVGHYLYVFLTNMNYLLKEKRNNDNGNELIVKENV